MQPSEQKSSAVDEEMKKVASQLLELGVSIEKPGTKSMSPEVAKHLEQVAGGEKTEDLVMMDAASAQQKLDELYPSREAAGGSAPKRKACTNVIAYGKAIGLSADEALMLAPMLGESMGNCKGHAAFKLHSKRWIRDLKMKDPSFQRRALDVLYST
eukprot:3658179-Pleurochrysis_carterae.AAC.1